MARASASSSTSSNAEPEGEDINPHDLCPVCHLLLYRPVTTTCTHSLCESCMTRWAAVSNVQGEMETFEFEALPEMDACLLGQSTAPWRALLSYDQLHGLIVENPLEATCPMCRSKTTAVYNPGFAANLRSRYPLTYEEREREDAESSLKDANRDGEVIAMELLIGNKHRLLNAPENTRNTHEWIFFVKPSRTDFIEEVEIRLHETFSPPVFSISEEPYSVQRIGWGFFTIVAHVILKPGYTWLSEDAERGPDGREKGMLHLDWTLDFNGSGSLGRMKVRVKKEAYWTDNTTEDNGDDDDDDMPDTIE